MSQSSTSRDNHCYELQYNINSEAFSMLSQSSTSRDNHCYEILDFIQVSRETLERRNPLHRGIIIVIAQT